VVVIPVPVGVTPEIVMFEFPLFVSVTFNDLLLPILTFPNARFVGFAPSRKVAATPVPLTGMESGEPGAVFVSDTDPFTRPADVCENTMLKEEFLPARIDVGSVRPLMLIPAPVGLAAEIVRVAVPLFVTVIVCELLVPVVTFPKLTVDGLAEICGWVPVPLKAIASGEPGALLVIETLPLVLPAVVGVNVAVNEVFALALIVTGTVSPLMLNPVPLAVAAVMVTLAVPEFVSVTDCDPLLPT